MNYKTLGRTGLKVSTLGFGCGMIGGLLVRGEYPAMCRTVARAIELGVNYFDTAPLYGDGQSEVNIGAVLRELRSEVLVGTKVRLAPADMGRIEAAVIEAVEASLRRLGRERVDLIQLHNAFTAQARPDAALMTVGDLEPVLRAFESLGRQGKTRFWGITALGETEPLHQVVTAGGFHTIQTPYNLLNPTAGMPAPPGFPFQDYRQLIDRAGECGMGAIAIRILAGGALSGTSDRHPTAARSVTPIASATEYAEDVARARRFAYLIEDGTVGSLVEAAIRFTVSKPEVSTALVGISSPEQLERAVDYANRGPLSPEALERIVRVQ
jgi:L-galactose dehydrogenase/L-glyceraldehyde 3-phosphate reductase